MTVPRIESGDGEHSILKVLEREDRPLYEKLAFVVGFYSEARCVHVDPLPVSKDGVALCDTCAADVYDLACKASEFTVEGLSDYYRGQADLGISIIPRQAAQIIQVHRMLRQPVSFTVEQVAGYIRNVITGLNNMKVNAEFTEITKGIDL